MAKRGEEAYPLVKTTASRESINSGGLNSRVSSTSDLTSPGSPPFQDIISPLGSVRDFHGPSGFWTSVPQDEIDTSHVKIAPSKTRGERQPQQIPHVAENSLFNPSIGMTRTLPSTLGSKRFSWESPSAYERLSSDDTISLSSRAHSSRWKSTKEKAQKRLSRHKPIPEEADDINLELMASASRFENSIPTPTYNEENPNDIAKDNAIGVGIDLSSFSGGLMGPQDEATVLQYRQLESEGQLTGGLGSGFQPQATLTSTALYKKAGSIPVDVTRRFSFRGEPPRAPTLEELAQQEANKRGKILEVILDLPEQVPDLRSYYAGTSNYTAHSAGNLNPPGGHGLKRKRPLTEYFYPQPNWKPISMRWPYLTFLVVVSIMLAAVQEYLYRKSLNENGLISFRSSEDISAWDYFSFKFLPVGVAVMYGILWQLTDFQVKRLEAYYQLSKDGGALAAESINVDYITIFNVLRPFVAIRYKHWAVAISSVASLFAISLVPTLQSASLILTPDRAERYKNPLALKSVRIDAIWSRFLTCTLCFIAFLGIVLLYQLTRRRSGLVGDVKGIAGVVAMATKSHVLMDFKDLDTAPPKEIHNKLKDHRYTLRSSSLVPDASVPLSRADKDKYDAYPLDANPHPLLLRPIATIPLLLSTTLFLAFIPILLFTPASIVTDKAPWLATALAVAIKIAFQTLEQDVRMMEPFYRLARRHAPPKILTLDYTGMGIGYMPVRALLNRHWLVAAVGFGTLFAEVLTVCVTSLAGVTGNSFLPAAPGNGTVVAPQGGDTPGHPVALLLVLRQDINQNQNATQNQSHGVGTETPLSFWFSFGLSVFIILYLILTGTITLLLRHRPFLPRQPSTVASVLAMVHQSKMLYDFVSIGEREDTENMVRRLEAEGRTYGYGWFVGRDGGLHCGVDVEELRGGYVHCEGRDPRRAVVNGGGGWDVW